MMSRDTVLLPDRPASIEDYLAAGGGEALRAALDKGPEWAIDEVRRSGLRGRGGAGFPTGIKWRTVRGEGAETRYLAVNAAEGEPGTFKDRWIIRMNPYQVLEGIAIAAFAVGAEKAFVGIKAGFEREIGRLGAAMGEMEARGMLGPTPIQVVPGPDEYLFGEEKALLEVIEGNAPLPRVVPPYMEGLFRAPGRPNPTVVNNVETLANVPHILREGADRYRSIGTDSSPGTMVFTVVGDVRHPGMYEVPLGMPLRDLIVGIAGGPAEGRELRAIFPGASSTVLVPEQLDTPLDFDAMRQVGSGLGSGGFVVYDDTACMVRTTLAFCRFLYIESCAQCPACKHGSGQITELLERLERGEGTDADLDTILARAYTVTDAQKCALPTGTSLVSQSALQLFDEEFAAHVRLGCRSDRDIPVPKLMDFDEETGTFTYDDRYRLKRPDWTYADD
jgi:NADH-quinone oxidoreductase subunit F